MGRIAGRGKVAYIWISPDPAKAGLTLGVVVVIVVVDYVLQSMTVFIIPLLWLILSFSP